MRKINSVMHQFESKFGRIWVSREYEHYLNDPYDRFINACRERYTNTNDIFKISPIFKNSINPLKHGLTFSSDVEDSSSDEIEDDRVLMANKFKECGLVYWHESTTCLRVMIPKSAHWVTNFEISDQDEIVLKQFRNLPPEAVISEDFHEAKTIRESLNNDVNIGVNKSSKPLLKDNIT
ncbi:hypothetical protein BC833DRAFT_642186 [Globomyces pollinis-pini]|nr:hypothetical protein BC833DRAFT_642186 [Globomyces pollinis-pini]